ncbi:ubiquitin-conjugating enzyme E2 variant [Terriglobus aquaticus]|uniref:Ubiquitin-conjugating enzyme E2 variant n=1 Tax=Terriglobus aquaticus TaxID=940139 RepID=A0ABW9KFP4_9BACT|nr:ubiquitin-conjugating enzyme E2 [Terriglobus aquaticus]
MFPATERRLAAEWSLLQQLSAANPGRITQLRREEDVFYLTLHGPAAVSIPGGQHGTALSVHDLRIEFPVHFPAVPMEMYLSVPVVHPNVHPETGFVCLWDRHRVSNTVEIAMHKVVAMLAGTLWNPQALHVMQPAAVPCTPSADPMLLQGVAYEPSLAHIPAQASRRKRLS